MASLTEIGATPIGRLDLGRFVTAGENALVDEVVERMRACLGVPALIVRDGRLVGIFTRRDVTRKVLGEPLAASRPVSELMTRDPTVAPPELDVRSALRLMRDGSFRDLPVVAADGELLGNLTDVSVCEYIAGSLAVEVLNLPPRPGVAPASAEGA